MSIDMRITIKNLRSLIIEAAIMPSSLPNSIRFFETGDDHVHYLYLVDADKMPNIELALIAGISVTTLGGAWHVGSVSAHEGYGPLMYRLAMEWVGENGSGRGLTQNPGETSDAARRVWNKFDSIKRQQNSGIKSHPVSDPMKPELSIHSGDLKKLRSRWIELTPAQSNEAWGYLIDLSIGGQASYDEEN